MENCKVLVVGGAGYIGGGTVDLLASKGYDVTVFDNLLYEDRYLKDVPFVFGDIREPNKQPRHQHIDAGEPHECFR